MDREHAEQAQRPFDPWRDAAVVLPDGRVLGVAEFGPSDGFPVLWFHGTPGARRQVPPAAVEHARRKGVRIVAVERPGVGRSSPHHYDRIADFADDIEDLAAALKIVRFGVMGLSGGGPYVLAVCARMPQQVVAAALLGGVAPTTGSENVGRGGVFPVLRFFSPLLTVVREPAARAMSLAFKAVAPVADRVFDLYVAFGPRSDRRLLARPEMRTMFLEDLVGSGRRSFAAIVYDAVLFSRAWGFDIADIETPVYLWHGDADLVVPLEHGERMAALIPNSRLSVVSGEGHLAMLDVADEAIDLILSHAHDLDELPGTA